MMRGRIALDRVVENLIPRFCGPAVDPNFITPPYVCGGWLIATDGIILVRTPAPHKLNTVFEGCPRPDESWFADLVDCDGTDFVEWPKTPKLIAANGPCMFCDGCGGSIRCPYCKGAGDYRDDMAEDTPEALRENLECDFCQRRGWLGQKCENCDGANYDPDVGIRQDRLAEVLGVPFAVKYDMLIRLLPGPVRVTQHPSLAADDGLGLGFLFPGGQGILVGVKDLGTHAAQYRFARGLDLDG